MVKGGYIMKSIIKRRFISLGLRSILVFFAGFIIITGFFILISNEDILITIIFSIVLSWLLFSLIMFSFSTLVFKENYIKVRGDFAIETSQIQKATVIEYAYIKAINIVEMKEHTNSHGETLKFTYKYGNERFIIYGQQKLKCIEIMLTDKIEQIVINKYSEKQIIRIFEILKNNTQIHE